MSDIQGKIWLVVGQRGSGKTTILRSFAKKAHPEALFIHDVSDRHYKDIYLKPQLPIGEFNKKVVNIERAVIIYDEASVFFRHTRNEDAEKFCVKSRYVGNTIVFAFHSFRKVPWQLLDYTDFIVIKKTKDVPSLIDDKFQDVDFTNAFNRVNASPDPYAYEIFNF